MMKLYKLPCSCKAPCIYAKYPTYTKWSGSLANERLAKYQLRSTIHTNTFLTKNAQKKTIINDDDDDDNNFSLLKSLLWKKSTTSETKEKPKEIPKKNIKYEIKTNSETATRHSSSTISKAKKPSIENSTTQKDAPSKKEDKKKEPEQPVEIDRDSVTLPSQPVKKETKRKPKKDSSPSTTETPQEGKKEEEVLEVLTLWPEFVKQQNPSEQSVASFLSSLIVQGAKIPEEQAQNYIHLFTISRIWRPSRLITLDRDDLKKLGIEESKHRAAIIQLIEKLPKDIVPPEPERVETENLNKTVSDVLDEVASIQRVKGDPHRFKMYSNAAKSIRNYPFALLSVWYCVVVLTKKGKEAMLNIPGIGPKIAMEIDEVLDKGVSQRLQQERSNEDLQFVNELSRVTGVGPIAAKSLISQGVKTLEDLKSMPNLTHHQQLGLKYLDELELRIPRSEMIEMEKIVLQALKEVDEKLIGTPCGSYRRGSKTSGDLDMLLTHPDYTADTKHTADYLKRIVENLKAKGFLTDDLSFGNVKYMGICQLPSLVPFESYYCGLLYFTGSSEFNKWMRGIALEKGFTLSEYTICPLVKEQHESTEEDEGKKDKKKTTHKERHKEKPLLVTSEEDVFKHLGLEYIKPEDRNFT